MTTQLWLPPVTNDFWHVTQHWVIEAVELDTGMGWAVYDDNVPEVYLAIGLDKEQAELAVSLLKCDALGFPTAMLHRDLSDEIYYQVDRVPCQSCAAEHPRAAMLADDRGLTCRECQP